MHAVSLWGLIIPWFLAVKLTMMKHGTVQMGDMAPAHERGRELPKTASGTSVAGSFMRGLYETVLQGPKIQSATFLVNYREAPAEDPKRCPGCSSRKVQIGS